MKNLNYFPFERNRYYYGKLLTPQDFTAEQKYFNDKRRMLNRFLHGTGVVSGLSVVGLDEKTVSLEAGIALDGAGREIVVEHPEMLRLEQIDGFQSVSGEQKQDALYLCLEYKETEGVPVFNAASLGVQESDQAEASRYLEGYHLYLTDKPLTDDHDTLDSMFLRRTTLYEDAAIRVVQEYPTFVKSGEHFPVSLIFTSHAGAGEWNVSVQERLGCAAADGSMDLSVKETLRFEGSGEEKRVTAWLDAYTVEMGEVEFLTGPGGVLLESGGKKRETKEETAFRIPIVNQDSCEVLKERHFKDRMDQITQNPYPKGIYLAKIYLVRTGSVYLIDHVEQVPFGQYVYTPMLAMEMLEVMRRQQLPAGDRQAPEDRNSPVFREERKEKRAEGTVEIELGVGGKRGQRFFSHKIVHGLGLGKLSISLSMEQENEQLFGSAEIFEEAGPKAELAARADISRGSFVIGVRLLEATGQQSVTVHWSAVMKAEEEIRGSGEQRLSIRPEKPVLHVREVCYLEAVTENLPGAVILWKVTDERGGSVARDGMYTAPNQPGVYEVQAWCQEKPEIRASIYVIVRE